MPEFSKYTDDELRQIYNWLDHQRQLAEDELAWRGFSEQHPDHADS